MRRILSGLLSFVRPHRPEVTDVRLVDVLDSVVEVLAYECRTRNIDIRKDFEARLPLLASDPHRLRLAFLLLVHNLCTAIAAGASVSSGARVVLLSSHQKKGAIEVDIRETREDAAQGVAGCPVLEAASPQERLGYEVAQAIVVELGGTIRASRAAGTAGSITVLLPASGTGLVDEPAPVADSAPARSGPALRSARILVVDDETDILDVFQQILRDMGHFCDVAISGEAALKSLAESPWDLVILDWNMPGVSGREVYEAIRRDHPDLAHRVLIITGNVNDPAFATSGEDGGLPAIEKPFLLETVQAAVAKALELDPA